MKPKFRTYLQSAVLVTVLVASSAPAGAATIKWDPAGGGASDGTGSWLDTGKWWDGAANVEWNNTTPDSAVIGSGGAGGTITLGAVTAGTVLLDNFTGTYELKTGPLNQSGGITIGLNAGNVNLPLPISGAGGITVNGPVRVNLRDGGKTFSGNLNINAGEVLDHQFDDLGTGNLTLNGGVLVGYWGETMNRTLGSGAGQVQLPGGASGFTGQGSSGVTVRINNDANFELQWGSTYFNPSALVLQSPWANTNGNLWFTNPIDLNGASRIIAVNKDHAGNLGGFARMNGAIRNSDAVTPSGITKTGPGRLVINNPGNSWDGPTVVNEGILQIGANWPEAQSIPGGITVSGPGPGSNLVVNDAMIAVWFTFTRALGTGGTEVQFTGGTAGITQRQGDRGSFVFGSASTEVVWGTASFSPDVFVINDPEAGPATGLRWDNPIDLNGGDRVIAAKSTLHGGTLPKNIRNTSGTAAKLIKRGPGTIILQGSNTYDGGTEINEGKLQFDKLVSMPASGDVAVNNGGTLVVKVGGSGEWTASGTGNGTIDGLLNGLGGQSGGTVSYSGNITLGIVPTGSQTYTGVVGDKGTSLGIDHAGSGTLELSGDNTYSGSTFVSGGGLLILSGDNSGAAGNMTISNGYLNVGADGAGLTAGQVRFESSVSNPAILQASGTLDVTTGSGGDIFWPGAAGGFAATDSALTVTFNGGVNASWRGYPGFGGDNKPQMGSPTSTAPVEITNNLGIGWASNIRLFDNPASSADISILSGNITSNGTHTLNINGAGTLWLSGTNDFNSGTLQLNDGVVIRAVDGVGLGSTAKLFFNNGILESSGSFTRNIANSAGNVFWNNQGGFAAAGGALNVSLNGGVALDWSNGNNGFNNRNPLYLGSATADNVVTFRNDIELRNNRNINVPDNPDTPNDYAVVSGVISNGDGTPRNLTKDNNGTLVLSGDNSYTGITTVNGGTLIINGDQTAATGLVDVRENGRFLGGTGTIGGSVTLKNNAGLIFDLTTAPGSHDKLDVLGTFTFEGASVLTITSSGGASPGTYTLVTAGSAPTGSVPATFNLPVDWTADAPQIVGNDLVINITSTGSGPSYPYDIWSGGAAFGDDANGDGVSNGLAFLLGAANPNANALGLLPKVGKDAGGLVLKFQCLDAASRGPAALKVQWSNDLGLADLWSANEAAVPEPPGGTVNGVVFVVTENAGDPTRNDVVATIPSTEAASGKLFGRLSGTE